MIPPAMRHPLPPVLATVFAVVLAVPASLPAQPSASLAMDIAAVSHATPVHPNLAQPDFDQPVGELFASLAPEMQGDLLTIRHQYLAAIDAYHHAPRDSTVVWNKLGVAYQHMYAFDFARLQYEKALALDPNNADALNNLGTVFYAQRNYRKAEKLYRSAIRVRPDTACFFSNLGAAYFADRKYRQGLAAYQQAFALDPKVLVREAVSRIDESGPPAEQARMNYALAKLYAQAGDLDAAMRCLRAAFLHGFDDRKHLMADRELAALRETAAFHLFMAEQHWEIATATAAR